MYLFNNSGPLTLMKFSPHSFATAEANSVLPQPGYPYRSNLMQFNGERRSVCLFKTTHPERRRSGHLANMAPYLVGHSRVSRRIRRVSCKPYESASG